MPAKSKGRSRNSTPMSAASSHDIPLPSSAASEPVSRLSYDEILDNYCKGQSPPPSSTLRRIADALKICSEITRGNVDRYDRGMRDSSQRKKQHLDEVRRAQHAERQAEEDRRERAKHHKAKKEDLDDDARPLAVGAHALAPQDGSAPASDQPVLPPKSPPRQPSEQAPASPADSASSDEAERPPPPVPQFETFGKDPSTFDDPTVYDIRPFDDETTEEIKKEILGVTHYPASDLHDLTCGTPPDRDFSNAKPANQVSAQHFLNAIEPYIRTLASEDTAFLEERGDRTTPFEMPKKGTRSYKEVWAEEDGTHVSASDVKREPALESDDADQDPLQPPPPMLARLLSVFISERRDLGGSATNGDGEREETAEPAMHLNGDDSKPPLSPSNRFPEASSHPGWKNSVLNKPDPAAIDQRLKDELKHIGFLSDDTEPDYDGHYDDEVAARLRYLQEELERISIINGARKARVLELAEERMAQQEWSTIADDLDSQLNQAYLKRHRNIGKGKKQLKRPGGHGGGSHLTPGQAAAAGLSKPGVGEPIRSLMERRKQWIDTIGPVVDFGRTNIPQDTIFDDKTMERLIVREKESWTNDTEA